MHPVEVNHLSGRSDARCFAPKHDDAVALNQKLSGLEPLNLKHVVHGREELRHRLPAAAIAARRQLRWARGHPADLLVERLEQRIDVATPERLVTPPDDIEITFAHTASFACDVMCALKPTSLQRCVDGGNPTNDSTRSARHRLARSRERA